MGAFGVPLPRSGRPPASMGGLTTQSTGPATTSSTEDKGAGTASPSRSAPAPSPISGGGGRRSGASTSRKTQAGAGGRFPSAVGALSRTAAGQNPSRAGLTNRVPQGITDRVKMESLKNLNPRAVAILESQMQKTAFARVGAVSDDQVSLTKGTVVGNTLFNPKDRQGIARFRPEILLVQDFLPAFTPDKVGLTGAGQLLELQYQALVIRNTMIKNLLQEVLDSDPDGNTSVRAFQELSKAFLDGRASIKETLDVYGGWLDALEFYTRALDIRNLPAFAFDQTKYLTLRDLMERHLGFSRGSLETFTDTKVMGQVIQDLGWILDNYSPSLVNAEIVGRSTDSNPVRIQKSYESLGRTLGFRPRNLGSTTSLQKGSSPGWFTQFLNSLPSTPANKIKVLTVALSKEIRVSKTLGVPATKTRLQEMYQTVPQGNPFDNIVGSPGDTILDEVRGVGENSLTSVLQVVSDDSKTKILPFEKKYFDDQDTHRVFVPGSEYLVDSILQNVPQKGIFDTGPFSSYVEKYQKAVQESKVTIYGLTEMNRPQAPTHNLRVLQSVARGYQAATSGLLGSGPGSKNLDQALILSLFHLANEDQTLKNMVLEYTLLLGVATRQGDKSDQSPFHRVARDYQNIQGFSFVKAGKKDKVGLDSGVALAPWLETLAGDIESKVVELTRLGGKKETHKIRQGIERALGQTTSGKRNATTKEAGLHTGNQASKVTVPDGTLRDTLIRAAQVSGTPTTNLLKVVLDTLGGIDHAAGGNQEWLIPDGSGRTRFHFWSTSTVGMVVFELVASMVGLFGGATFQTRGMASTTTMTVIFDEGKLQRCAVAISDLISRSPNQGDVDTFHDKIDSSGLRAVAARPGALRPGVSAPGAVSGRVSGGIRTALGGGIGVPGARRGGASSSQTSGGVRQITSVLGPAGSGQSLAGILVSESGRTGGGTASTGGTSPPPRRLGLSLDLVGTMNLKTSLGGTNLISVIGTPKFQESLALLMQVKDLADKVDEENLVVDRLFHILEVVGKRLEDARTKALTKFSEDALTKFLARSGMTLEDMKDSTLFIPSQIRTSTYLHDWYTQRVTVSTTDGKAAVFVDDLPPPSRKEALFSWLRDPERCGPMVHKNLKFMTVGIPAGFSKEMSDRVWFANQGVKLKGLQTNDKQFDLVSVNVYKRDARFDDLVFKPQKWLFDLSLFVPFDIPADQEDEVRDWRRWAQDQGLLDYQSPLRARATSLEQALTNPEYEFLGETRIRDLWMNHVQSELLDLYIQFSTGQTVSEDSFLEVETRLSQQVESAVGRMLLGFLRDVKGKTIPAETIEEALLSPGVDEETKDILTVLSHGNLMFHTSYLKKNILGMKKFDRVFTIPVDTDRFEVDVPLTTSTPSGKAVFEKRSVQDLLETDRNGRVFLSPRRHQDLIFSDYFVVIEQVTR